MRGAKDALADREEYLEEASAKRREAMAKRQERQARPLPSCIPHACAPKNVLMGRA